MGDHIVWEVTEFEVHIFASSHRDVEIEILYIDYHEFCIGRGDDAVEEEFNCEEVDCGHPAVSNRGGEEGAIRVCLFWPVLNNYSTVGDIAPAVGRDILFRDENNCVGAVSQSRYSLGKAAELFSL